MMRVLAIGDVLARPGRDLVRRLLPSLIRDEAIDVVVANAENSAGGIGTTIATSSDLLDAGVHVLTGGNHSFKLREFYPQLERKGAILRPMNYPAGAPGRGFGIFQLADGRRFAVINLIGRLFMEPNDNPFAAADRALTEIGDAVRVILVDMHAEASSEKRAMGFYLDGRASVVWGSHTHVPTADEEILPRGTGYLSDVGMTGPYLSVIGFDPESAVKKFLTGVPAHFKLAEGNVQLRGLIVDIDESTGHTLALRRITRTD